MNTLYVLPLLLLVSAAVSENKYPNFHLYRDCLHMCLICVERWGLNIYNGEACANTCRQSLGEDVDSDCSRGQSGKRYTAREEICLKSCDKCIRAKGGDKRRMSKCYSNCVLTGVRVVTC